MVYQQINNGESGSSVRAKLNAMLSALITGAEGNNELWRSITSIKEQLKGLSDTELSTKYAEIIRQGREYTDTKVEELYSYMSAASGLVDVAVSLDYVPKFSKEQGGLVLTSLYGNFTNLHITIPKPSGPCLFILYKAAGSEVWNYSSVDLGVSFASSWGNNTNSGLTQKFLTENTIHKEDVSKEFTSNEDKVLSASFVTKITNIINVDTLVPLNSGLYSSNTAREAIPQGLRKKGLVITYSTANGQVVEQFIGSPTSWSTDSLWVTINQKFKMFPFNAFVKYSGNIESGEPSNINEALINFNETSNKFLYYHDHKVYNVSDGNYATQNGNLADNIMYVSQQGILFNSPTGIKAIKYGFPTIVDNLTTDDSTKVLSASQGVKIRALIDEGYKFFGELSKTHATYKNHDVKGFYLLTQGGEYQNVQINGRPLNVPAWSFLIVDNGNLEVLKAPEFALQKDLTTLKESVDNIETIKTSVLAEDDYKNLVSSGNVENDRFYFTHEE